MRASTRAFSATVVVSVLLVAALCQAMSTVYEEGKWPMNWPGELSPFRSRARTIEIAPWNHETVYEISFQKRENFEKLWPIILKLKSKRAPLRLRIATEPPQRQDKQFVSEGGPMVRIYCPPYGNSSIRDLGMASPTEPAWPESVRWRDGTLPEYAAKSDSGDDWVGVLEERRDDPWGWLFVVDEHPPGFRFRARIEIELAVDGTVIDLNRIPLPTDTPIIDRREPPEAVKAPHVHSAWLREILVLIESVRPGATRHELLEIFTTEGGLSTRSSRTYVYKGCRYIKVDVNFRPTDGSRFESPEDIVTKISRPYVAWSIMD